jgi:hypothetical protein
VSEEDLAVLRSSAIAVVFPSLYEGFGMPVLEAMADGVPVACIDKASLPEICAGAASMFDPRKPHDIARSLLEVWSDPARRAALSEAGRVRAAAFGTVDDMAKEYIALFERAMASAVAAAPRIDGVYPDRWTGAVLTLHCGSGGTHRDVALTFHAPEWLPHRKAVSVTCGAGGRKFVVPLGTKPTLEVEIGRAGGPLVLTVEPSFYPTALGPTEDRRELGLMLERAVLRDGKEEVDLLAMQ